MAVVLLWPMLAGLLAAGYFAWSASFAEWLYLKSVWLSTLEHALGLSHRLTVEFEYGGEPHRPFVEDFVQYFASNPMWLDTVHSRLVGGTLFALAMTLALYGLVGRHVAPAGAKRHVRGANVAVTSGRHPVVDAVSTWLALGFGLTVFLWCLLALSRIPHGEALGLGLVDAFKHVFQAVPPSTIDRRFTLLVAGMGYTTAAVFVLNASWLWESLGSLARRHRIPWRREAITVGGIPIPFEEETQSFLIAGRPGSGKTLLIQEMMRGFRKRGDRALIADPDGGYLSRFARAGDRLLNPFDARSERWSPFAELRSAYDYTVLANAVIPESDSPTEEEWRAYGRTLLAATLKRLHEDGRPHAAEVIRTINSAGDEELAALFAGTNAAGLRRHDDLFNSVVGVVAPRIASWEFLPEPDETHAPFSIRDWVRNTANRSGDWLYLTYRDDQREALQFLTATWISLAMTEMLSLPENLGHRLVCALDEFDSLGKVGALEYAPPKLRKHGGVLIIGLHTKAQADRTYGPPGAQIIMSSVGHKAALGLGDHETAQYFEKELGSHEVERVRTTQGTGMNARGGSRSHSTSREAAFEPVVMASELMGLKDRHGYFRRAGSSQIHKIRVPLVKMPIVLEPFVPRA